MVTPLKSGRKTRVSSVSPHTAPVVNANAGALSIYFTNAQNGSMTLPDGRVIPLTRFVS